MEILIMKKIALIIGHSETSQGAVNSNSGMTEFLFNEPLAHLVATKLITAGYEPLVIYRGESYSSLPGDVNKTGADIAVSLHCNAFNKESNGTETLYFKGSQKGFLLASCIQEQIVKCLGLKDRGIKPCKYKYVGKAGDRGGYLLEKTAMPCVIVELFFIDSDTSLELASLKIDELAQAYTKGIQNFIKGTL